ncbi:MAG TPA: ATP-binding protein [Chryseobacterium sp.]|nr:ATP-binding protein [Chryseobacterium sp.]
MSNDLVAYSRAGDVFHYRWAARRCLSLIYPNSSLQSVVIEGSKEDNKEGEYVIDVSEYYSTKLDESFIKYYQLKHTTQQKDSPFVISDLKDTIEGFAKRFSQHLQEARIPNYSFYIVTNRAIEPTFKKNIICLAEGKKVNNRFLQTIKKYTGLNSVNLSNFCSLLEFQDGEGDYNNQKNELRWELSQIFAGAVDNALVENIVSLVHEKILPDSNRIISREDILKRFGFSSEKELFPAPAIWETSEHIVIRKEHMQLIDSISNSEYPVIVHASGGIGKSVFCRTIVDTLPSHSVAIAYDCFGAGRYRNRSEPRHRHRDALVQIVNELAVKGLCNPILVQDNTQDSNIMTKFLWSIESAVKALKKTNNTAKLFILIDAADNAEMAAQENSDPCFAKELLREIIPEGCKLVLLCRTERIELLKPSSKISKLELKAFSKSESLLNLKKWFPEADHKDGYEFHRLTSGNPRVQANALTVKASTIAELLNRLGPAKITVEKQIELQLNNAVSVIKDQLSESYQDQIQAICMGLASLPPHIPIEILAKAAAVSNEAIKSFVSDIGRSLWLSDASVQFRDEPTETWFRKTFFAEKENFETYISVLEPLANQYTYVAEVLPHLYLQSEKYQELIELALSEDYLPQDNPIDARNVRVYRLQFAFRAALKAKQYDDAIKVAVRAGEEVAGNQRQLNLFQKNIDLLVVLQNKQKVQDIAFKRSLVGEWNGSENVYTASLLSGIEDYKGEARGYLRAAINWLKIYYEDYRDKNEEYWQNKVTSDDILEIAYSYINIYGIKDCITFLNRFKSKEYIFGVLKSLAKRLIDLGNFKTLNDLLENCIREPYYVLAFIDELAKIGKFPERKYLQDCLILLSSSKSRIKKPDQFYSNTSLYSAIVTFIEACVYNNFEAHTLLRILRYYIPERASTSIYKSYQSIERTLYLRTLALRSYLDKEEEINIKAILPKNLLDIKKKTREDQEEVKEFREVIYSLLPWYLLRIKIVGQNSLNFLKEVSIAQQKSIKARSGRYKSYDTLENEIADAQSLIIIISTNIKSEDLISFYKEYIKENKNLLLSDELALVRTAFRSSHIFNIKEDLESQIYSRIKGINSDGPEEMAERFIGLARAVLNLAPEDASVYFEEAVNIVSKFGDEIVLRWQSVVSLSKQACLSQNVSDQLAYRFIRCAEIILDYGKESDWDSSEAIVVCTRMSSGMGLAALSRWRDKNVGEFTNQLKALLTELLSSDKISAPEAWGMTRFCSDHHHKNLLSLCLEKEKEIKVKEQIFADALNLLQIQGTSLEYYKEIEQIALQNNIKNDVLNDILTTSQDKKEIVTQNSGRSIQSLKKVTDKTDWKDLFQDWDILIVDQFEKCLKALKIKGKHSFIDIEDFWQKIFLRLNNNDYFMFIDVLLNSSISRYEIALFFRSLPEAFKNKVSFRKKWPSIIKHLGEKYASELTGKYSLDIFIKDLSLTKHEILQLKDGICEGLANGQVFFTSDMFFGFVSIATPFISANQAIDLTDFALQRFEIHIKKDFGEGEWSDLPLTSKSITNQLAGFIWSALGSPESKERWNSAHALRTLCNFNCIEIFHELIKWLEEEKVGAFGHVRFPFYLFHAKMYLFITFARVSKEKPDLLIPYKKLFIHYAMEEKHILIQKFATEIILNLPENQKNDFDPEILRKLQSFGKSNLPVINLEYGETVDSYWHIRNNVNTDHDFHFGLDMGSYWFKYLGEAFGISTNQIEDLAAQVIIEDWRLGHFNGYRNDPRNILWDQSHGHRDTWYHKTDYPRTDDVTFYLSYHSMMVVAAKLLEKMSLVSKGDWNDGFDYWMERHLLTCEDGMWLADFRDPVPSKRPEWMFDNNSNWRSDIQEQSFYNALVTDSETDDIWLNVEGGWEEIHHSKNENIHVRSALVSKSSSFSLMSALQTCNDPYDYRLPNYKEKNSEIDSVRFKLRGWIEESDSSKRFDDYDPYADNIDYPPYIIGEEIRDRLKLKSNYIGKDWFINNFSIAVLKCQIWSSYRRDLSENPNQSGKVLKASLYFLKHLCKTFDCNIIIEVEIKRDVTYKYRRNDDNYEYLKPIHKLFLLSEDGKLRTTEKDYKLR